MPSLYFFFFNDTATTEIYTLSLHDALPISRIVRVPLNRAGTLHRIGKRSASLLQELGREPTVEEIAEGMDISEEEVAKTLSISQAHLSLDAPLTPGEDNKLLDYLPDTQNPGPDDEIFEHALTEPIEEVL